MRAYDIATARPWLLPETVYRDLLEIAERARADEDLAATIRAARASRPAAVALKDGRPLDDARGASVRDGVALIPITGPIFRYADLFTEISGATALSSIAADFGAALRDPGVNAILFWIDSPGGEATGIADFAETVYQSRSLKPLEAYCETACSAAYWIASATERITTEANGLLGSVGTVMTVPDPTKRTAREIEIVSSQSKNKRPDITTEGGRAQYQRLVDQMTETFINAVARNRKLSPDQVMSDFDHGGVLVGAYAVAAGMADGVGTFEQTLASLAQRSQSRPFRQRSSPALASEIDRLTTRIRSNVP